MYFEHFALKAAPFSIAPDPHYLFMSDRHREALAHLVYGIRSDGGFILLTGEVGTGKTTLCRCLLGQIPENVDTAFVLNPRLTAVELLAAICDEYHISYPESASLKTLVDLLNRYLLDAHARSRRCVLIIDEAQLLSIDVLEQLRLLTNLETSERKLLQIMLLGQPELLEMLARPALRQFSQRITARFHLDGLTFTETKKYIAHRLAVAGSDSRLFTTFAIRRIYALSKGIPRVINLICDRALLGAYARHQSQVDALIVNRAAREVLGQPPGSNRLIKWFALGSIVILGVYYSYALSRFNEPAAEVPARIQSAPAKIVQSPKPEVISLPKGHQHIDQAYQDMFALWGSAFEEESSSPCTMATTIGLGCFTINTNLSGLTSLDRPAIVNIDNTWLTLTQITNNTATLIAGSRQWDLPVEKFLQIWSGDAQLLWRMPPAYRAPLKRGDAGPSVDWLAIQLEIIHGQEPALAAHYSFDANIEAGVKTFQASVGLPVNGIVDVPTWIHLNSRIEASVPTLNRREG